MTDTYKPLILLVRPKSNPSPDSIGVMEDETTELLSLHFRVSVIAQDFDYERVCASVKPDFVIFDSPGLTRMFAPAIANSHTHPHIPRVGFMHQDPHDTARVEFLRWMDELKVERIFVCGTAALRQSPDLMDRCFALPLYFDPRIFYDRQLEKTTPVTALAYKLTPEFYTWRDETARLISNYIPTLLYIHPGYTHPAPAYRYPISADMYARMIGRSHFSLSDTTRLDYLVRKHLDIPGSGTILVSSNTPELGFYGFVDMKNCIMGSGNEVVDKIAYVASNPDMYRSICRAGHDLVHSRFTMEKWTGLRDWFDCYKSLKPGEVVQQQGVFGPFKAIKKDDNAPALNAKLYDNELTVIMKDAREKILRGENLETAEEALKGMLSWVGHISEPWIFLALITLLRGDPEQAKTMLLMPYGIRVHRDKVTCYDPEEIAWILFHGLLTDDQELIQRAEAGASQMNNISLRRMFWLKKVLAKEADIANPPADISIRKSDDRYSIHWLGSEVSLQNWLNLINRILVANNKKPIA